MTILDDPSLAGDRPLPGWFLFAETSPALRVWSGFGRFRLPADNVDQAGGLYLGVGAMTAIPAMKLPMNGVFSRLDFSLSGVSKTVRVLANAERATVRNARISLGLLAFGDDRQPLGSIVWLGDAIADTPKFNRNGTANAPVETIALSAAAGDVARNQRELAYYTGIDQRKRSPDDAFCDYVSSYAVDTTEVWPT